MDNALCRIDDARVAGRTRFGHPGDPRATAGTWPLFLDKQVKRWFEPSVRQVISLVGQPRRSCGSAESVQRVDPFKLAREPMLAVGRWDVVRGRGLPAPPVLIGRD
jgi:hypothetical protein